MAQSCRNYWHAPVRISILACFVNMVHAIVIVFVVATIPARRAAGKVFKKSDLSAFLYRCLDKESYAACKLSERFLVKVLLCKSKVTKSTGTWQRKKIPLHGRRRHLSICRTTARPSDSIVYCLSAPAVLGWMVTDLPSRNPRPFLGTYLPKVNKCVHHYQERSMCQQRGPVCFTCSLHNE